MKLESASPSVTFIMMGYQKAGNVMKSDYHCHSDHSPDSVVTMREHCEKALELGLQELCFTDHLDYGIKYVYPEGKEFSYETYFKGIEEVREAYRGRLVIKTGIEFGAQIHTLQHYRNDYQQLPFDFILLSSHEIDNQEFWRHDYQKGKTQFEYNRGYYQNLLEMVKAYDGYSVLAHLDVMKRYDQAGIMDDEYVIDLIELILKEVIKSGRGLEVNTSCVRYRLNDLTPSKRILKLYRDLGGSILSLGSDAHQVGQLGDHMEDIRQQLRELGFTHFYTYDKLKPIPHLL